MYEKIFVLFLLFALNSSLSIEKIESFFNLKNINAIYTKSCGIKEDVYLWKGLLKSNKMVSSLKNLKKLKSNFYRVGVFADLTCDHNIKFIEQSNLQKTFSITYVWLIKLKSSEDLKIISKLLDLRMDSDLTVTWDKINFFDIYRKIKGTSKLEMEQAYFWSGYGLEKNLTARDFNLERADFYGGLYPSDNDYDLKNLTNQLSDRTYNEYRDIPNRYYYTINLHLADLFNYSLVLKLTDDWGETNTGMMGQLLREETNIAIGPMKLTEKRMNNTDSTVQLCDFDFVFIFKQPRKIGSYSALSLQLSSSVWAILGFVSLTAAISFYISQRVMSQKDKKIEKSFMNGILFVVGTLTAQGVPSPPKNTSGRIISFFTLILGLMVATYYNAATLNALLSPSPILIKTIDDLVGSDVKLIFMDIPYFNPKAANRLISHAVVQKVAESRFPPLKLQEGLKMILKGYGFCSESALLYDAINKRFSDEDKCELSVITGAIVRTMNYLGKNSPYREMLKRGMIRMKEHGLVKRQLSYWYPSPPQCVANQAFVDVRLESVAIAFGIFSGGLISAGIIFIFEFAFRNKCRKKPRNLVI